MENRRTITILLLGLAALIATNVHATVRYVKQGATGSGASWSDASGNLQAMINASSANDEVWVAAGTYKPATNAFGDPNPADARTKTFVMKSGVKILGGFPGLPGQEGNASLRNWAANPTILSGDIDNDNILDNENSYNVIANIYNGLNSSAVLDGFIVTGGNANGINNSTIEKGGGMHNSESSPSVTNCTFTGNFAYGGGGMFNNRFLGSGSSPVVTNCSFFNNSGGGMSNASGCNPSVTNCTFFGNSALFGGGMINSDDCNPNVTNCIFWGNTSQFYNNSQILGSATVSYSIIEGGLSSCTNCPNGNGNADPHFVNAAGGNLRLQATSPAINVGNNAAIPPGVSTDLDGNPRIAFSNVDLGAYERSCIAAGNPSVFGNNAWNVYAWNAGGATINPNAWNQNYAGYCVNNNLNFNTQDHWGINASPSAAPGYQGCTVDNDNHSWSAKRKGFPAGNYRLDIAGHDDAAQLFINGTKVWEHNACCDSHTGVWQGCLGANDEVEFRVTEGGGGSNGALNFVSTPTGNPAVFGNNAWNVYAWNAGGANIPNAWNQNYAGYYVNNNLNFNTQDNWGINASPSAAPGYQGCTVGTDNHSWSAKRKGFPAGYYRLDVAGHDDSAQLFINGVNVWEHNGCCDNHTGVWTGALDAISEVEFRATEGSGGSMGALNFVTLCPSGNILYVKANATGANDGTSWEDAFTDLQSALNSSCPGITQIWVAAGTYKPTTGIDRTISFVMKNGVAIYGGFPGVPGQEGNFGVRNWAANVTTLSGEIGGAGNADNSYHVVFNNNNGLNNSAVLDGFTITGGNASGNGYPFYAGGGMCNFNSDPTVANCTFAGNEAADGAGMHNTGSSPTVTNCIFSGNEATSVGGGMYNSDNSSPSVSNCTFSNNSGYAEAGGMYNEDSSPTLTNCTFSQNFSDGTGGAVSNNESSPSLSSCFFLNNTASSIGGGVYNAFESSPLIQNCIFAGNSADNVGGAIWNNPACEPDIINCTFYDNTAQNGAGAIGNINSISAPTITNSIIWANSPNGIENYSGANPSVTHSIVQGGYPGTGNLNVDPLFISATDLHLQACSPAIDAGTSDGAPTNDLDGNARPHNAAPNVPGNFDMGAYEFQGSTPAPTALCQSITVQLDANHSVGVSGSQVNNGSTGCGTLSFLLNGETSLTFDCEDLGEQSVTLTVTDYFGNTATCNTTIEVADEHNPCCAPATAVCQTYTAQLDASGEATITASNVDGGSTYECGLQSMEVSPATFDCGHVGTPQSVTLTVTDINGDSDHCTATVTVEDNVAPAASCQDVTVYLDASGNGSTTAAAVDNGSSDACGIASLNLNLSEFNCENVGQENSVVLTVTDVNENTSSCTATVTVVDNVAPAASCQDVTVYLDASGNGSTTAAAVDNGSSDACGIASLSLNQTDFDCENVGQENSVVLTVTDVNENTSSCTATVTVLDNVAPAASCQDVTVYLDASGNGSTTAAAVDNGSSDACGIASLSLNQTDFDCENVGQENSVVLTVTDVNENTSSCTATVTVEDNVDPDANCQDVTVQLDASGNGSTTAAAVDNGSSDVCGIASLSLNLSEFNCENVGQENSVVLTVTDVNENTSSCTATVTVEDNVSPAANCQDVTVYLDASGNGSTTAAAVDNGSSDACGIASLSLNLSEFNCENVGQENSVVLTVTDVNENTSSCTATVTVEDNVSPAASCQDVTVYLDASGNGSTTAAAVDNGSSDACGIASLSLNLSEFNCENVGQENSVVLTVTDVNENTSTCTATVTVEDNVAPLANCQDVTVLLDSEGNGSTSAAAVNDNSSDACGIQSLSLSQAEFDCGDVGTVQVTLTVTDVNGNNAFCTADVTVEDNLNPTITCPAPITVNSDAGECSAVVTYEVSGSDNCSYTLAQTGGLASGSAFPVGTTTNSWTATDPSDHTATCSFTVTVVKTGDPDLLHAYTVIGFDEVKMKANTVQSGGVGVVNAGKKAKLEQNTMVTAANTFVKAPDLDLHGGSMVTTYHPGQVDINLMPVFQPNTAPCNNDVNIPDNSAPVMLGLACYGKITVGKNVSVTFSSNATVTVKELTLKEGSAVYFSQNTNLLIDKKLDADKYVDISNNGHSIWIFVEEDVKIDDGSDVAANVYTQKHLKVEKTAAGNPTYMTGLFIAEKIDSKDNVFWNWDADVCPFTPPLLLAGLTDFNAVAAVEQGQPRVDLSWITDEDYRNEHFQVEKTSDGVNFEPVLEKSSRYDNAGAHLYRSPDPAPAEGDWLYRLKITRKDGTVDYSEPRRVRIELPEEYVLFPNPASEQVNVRLSSSAGKSAVLQIINGQGVIIEERRIEALPAEPVSFDLNLLKDGIYWLNVQVEGKRSRAMRFAVAKL